MASELVLLGNRAATGGGGLHVSGPFAVELSGTEVQGNVAVNGSGGGVAARDCLALSITNSNLSSNSALAGTGGGVVASGCGRVLLREVAVEGNRALAGGGLHLVSTGPTGGSAWTGGLPTRSSQPPTAAVLVQLRIFGNAAAQELGGGSGPLGGEQGRGGGLYVSGAVGVALNGADFSGGNTARLGSSIATTQTCLARRGVQSSPGAAVLSPPPRGPAPAAHEQLRVLLEAGPGAGPQSELLAALEAITREGQCLPLALVEGTLLARPSEGPARTEQARYEVWTQDALHSAIYANCSATADGAAEALRSFAARQQATPLPPAVELPATGAPAHGQHADVRKALLQCLPADEDKGFEPNAMTSILSQQPAAMRLQSSGQAVTLPPGLGVGDAFAGLNDISSGSTSVLEAADGFYYRYAAEPEGGGASPARPPTLKLRAGAAYDISVQLYDALGYPVVDDITPVDVNLTIVSGPPPAAGAAAASSSALLEASNAGSYSTGTDSTRPTPASQQPAAPSWLLLNPSLARLDPGLIAGRSLTQRVQGGTATWSQVVARGWPGQYDLLFTAAAASGPMAALTQVESLAVSVELLPCSVGEALEPSSSAQGALPSWTSCQPCGQEQLGLWRDTRTQLLAGDGFGSGSSSSTLDELQAKMSRTVVQLLDRSGRGDAAVCRTCPAMAHCPGGAVVVPQAGWWHSAANSTAIHRCPYAPACGRGGQLSLWQQRREQYEGRVLLGRANGTGVGEWDRGGTFGADVRAAALAWCQSAWYSSGWRPGAAVVASAALAGMLPASAATANTTMGRTPLGGTPAMPHVSENRLAATAPPCLLWLDEGLMPDVDPAAFAQLSYTQLQCAPSFTGNLCAACQPGHYSGARFQCSACPSVLRAAGLAVLAFLGSLAVVLVTAYATLLVDYTAEASETIAGSAEVLKALIVHVQHFIIVTRPPVDYPPSIAAATAVLSALTWAGEWWGFSPACLLPGQHSGGQARLVLAGGILGPCVVLAASLAVWAVRYWCFRRPLGLSGLSERVSQVELYHDLTSTADGIPQAVQTAVPSSSQATTQEGTSQLAACLNPTCDSSALVLASHTSSFSAPAGADNLQRTSIHQQATGGSLSPSTVKAELSQQGVFKCSPSKGSPDGPAASALATGRESASPPPPPPPPPLQPLPASQRTSASLQGPELASETPRQQAASSTGPLLGAPGIELACVSLHRQGADNGQLISAFGLDSATSSGAQTEALRRNSNPLQLPPLFSTTSKMSRRVKSRAIRLRSATSAALSAAGQRLTRLVPAPQPNSALAHADRLLPLPSQLGIVMWVAAFVLYPSWVQAALSVFACDVIDDGSGPYGSNQRATWRYGYWVRDMDQQCYSGVHLAAYVPVGVTAVLVFCVAPPLVSFLVLWRVRRRGGVARGEPDPLQHDPHTLQVYGFLYTRYRPVYWWWESVLQLQTLGLVAAEVFGRTLPVLHQALLLLCVLLTTAVVNTACAPVRSRLLVLLEFMSFSALAVTITLGLYFVGDEPVGAVPADAIGVVILVVNGAMLAGFGLLLGRRLWPSVRKLLVKWAPEPLRRGRPDQLLSTNEKKSTPEATA